jgi:hypothetical protein
MSNFMNLLVLLWQLLEEFKLQCGLPDTKGKIGERIA